MGPFAFCKKPPSASDVTDDDYEGIEKIASRMGVILPNSWFRSSWDWVLIVLVLCERGRKEAAA